jgi:hypothetical protein
VDRRTLDQLVQSITRELAAQEGPVASPAASGSRGFYLIDNWRVRAEQHDEFVAFYTRHVADVVKGMTGYRDGRVLSAPASSDYSWHVQALYEFESDAVLDRFASEFNRLVKRVDARMDLEKVLDAMDAWVLAHEDGTLTEVWR